MVSTEKPARLVFTSKTTNAGINVLPDFTGRLATLASLVNTPARSVLWHRTSARVAAKTFQSLWQTLWPCSVILSARMAPSKTNWSNSASLVKNPVTHALLRLNAWAVTALNSQTNLSIFSRKRRLVMKLAPPFQYLLRAKSALPALTTAWLARVSQISASHAKMAFTCSRTHVLGCAHSDMCSMNKLSRVARPENCKYQSHLRSLL